MVPSAAMGRDIPVAFQGGGSHAAVLLDAFNGRPDVSYRVGAGAFNTLPAKRISDAAPAGSDPAATIGYCDQAQGSSRSFSQHYRAVGGDNGHRRPMRSHQIGERL